MTRQDSRQRTLSGRYRLERRLGRGTSADVWAATDERLGREVAVKLFLGETDDPAGHRRVEAEMRVLAALRHPGLVTVHDAGFDDERPYLVMELVDGATLRECIDAGPLREDDAAALGAALADALAYVHSAGVVHRDVKPANVLLEDRDRQRWAAAKLADFGIARLGDAPRITAEGTAVGTANYLSPEQIRGDAAGPPSDVYSLGLVLLECLTGRLAYAGSGLDAALARLHRDPDIPETIGKDLRELLAAMTSREETARPTAAAVAAQLRGRSRPASPEDGTAVLPAARTDVLVAAPKLPPAAQPHVARTETGTAVLPVPPRRRVRPAHVLAALAVVLLVVVIAVLLASGGSGGDGGKAPLAPAHYPSVSGTLGTHLRQLEGAVG